MAVAFDNCVWGDQERGFLYPDGKDLLICQYCSRFFEENLHSVNPAIKQHWRTAATGSCTLFVPHLCWRRPWRSLESLCVWRVANLVVVCDQIEIQTNHPYILIEHAKAVADARGGQTVCNWGEGFVKTLDPTSVRSRIRLELKTTRD
jgi:hypothetical protein